MKDINEEITSYFNMNDDSLHAALNEFVENGPPETVWSALVSSTEVENVVAQEEGINILRHMEQDDLDNHECILDSDTGKAMSTLTLKYTTEA